MLRYLNNPFGFRLFDKPDDQGHDEEATPKPKRKATEETFSAQYVRELRMENKGYRLKNQETVKKLKDAEEAKTVAEKALETAQVEADKKAEQRVMRAELKAEAVKLGMIDLDGLAFLDYSSVKFDEKGELTGGADALSKLKEAKPHLFGEVGKTTSTSKVPPKKDNEPVDARKLSPKEYAELKASMGLR